MDSEAWIAAETVVLIEDVGGRVRRTRMTAREAREAHPEAWERSLREALAIIEEQRGAADDFHMQRRGRA